MVFLMGSRKERLKSTNLTKKKENEKFTEVWTIVSTYNKISSAFSPLLEKFI